MPRVSGHVSGLSIVISCPLPPLPRSIVSWLPLSLSRDVRSTIVLPKWPNSNSFQQINAIMSKYLDVQ